MSAIKSDPGVMHGVPCFAGTRVPAKTLFDCLAAGHSLDYFIYQFPSVKREQAQAVLKEARVLLAPDPEWLVEAERRQREERKQAIEERAGAA